MSINSQDLSIVIFLVLAIGSVFGNQELLDSSGMKIISVLFFVNLVSSEKPIVAILFLLMYITVVRLSSNMRDRTPSTQSPTVLPEGVPVPKPVSEKEDNNQLPTAHELVLETAPKEERKCGFVPHENVDYSLISPKNVLP